MMNIQCTCSECGSGIIVEPTLEATHVICDICQKKQDLKFTQDHMQGVLSSCPVCERKDFYGQKDFNRKLGVVLFVIAAILSIWTYGVSLIVLWLVDFFLFRRLSWISICYKCQTIFRDVSNQSEIHDFNHEMNDRIIYSDHDFEGKQLDH